MVLQAVVLHSEALPEHFFPPFFGIGLVQVLVLMVTPPPHVTLQVNDDHIVHPPSVATV